MRFKIPKTTVASSIRSVSTSIVVMRVTPLFRGNNLAVPYQQLHYSIHGFILSINRSSGRLLCIYPVFQSHKPQNRHTSRCACFPYITLYPATRCLLPQNQQVGYCTCRDDDDPADKRCCPLCPSLALRRELGTRSHQKPCCREAERAAEGIQQQIICRGDAARHKLYQLDAERGAETPPYRPARPLEPPPEQRQEQPERKQQRDISGNVHERAQSDRVFVRQHGNHIRKRNQLQSWLRQMANEQLRQRRTGKQSHACKVHQQKQRADDTALSHPRATSVV